MPRRRVRRTTAQRRGRSPDGIRVFGGRYYSLAGRGTKAECRATAARWRATGDQYVRIVPWHPFYGAALNAALDDYALFTFPKEPLTSR